MPQGPWNDRVQFGQDGTPHVPGVIAVDAPDGETAVREALNRTLLAIGAERGADPDPDGDPADGYLVETIFGSWFRVTLHPGDDPFDVAEEIRSHPLISAAQVIHVFFSHDVTGTPFYGTPFYGTPFYGTPFYGTPFYGTPFYGTPSTGQGPAIGGYVQLGGVRPSSARPVPPTGRNEPTQSKQYRKAAHTAILDTGWIRNAHSRMKGMNEPHVQNMAAITNSVGNPLLKMPIEQFDMPDGSGDGYLDPITGHGTFIAGIIERHAPGTKLSLWPVLTEYGDGREDDIATVLFMLADGADRPDVVNLSFGSYLFDSPSGPKLSQAGLLETAIRALQERGTVIVASAGNDGTFAPSIPAALKDVVGVAAVDATGMPAPFTNHGPWVRACAYGVDVVSLFFDGFAIIANEFFGADPKRFLGWASWSGSSFAAPHVAAAFAREIAAKGPVKSGDKARALVNHLLGPDTGPIRLPGLGTLVEND